MGQPSRTVATVADEVSSRPARRRTAGAIVLVPAIAALLGELRAPAPVLPGPLVLALLALAAVGLATLVVATGLRALVRGRELRAAALVPMALVVFLVAGPRFRLLVLMLWLLVGLLAVAVVVAALVFNDRGRDAWVAIVAVITVPVVGWFAAGLVRETRLAVHADRYRTEARALIERPAGEYPEHPGSTLDEPFLATWGDRLVVAWLWDPGEDGPAPTHGLIYAPEGSPPDDDRSAGGAGDCTAAVVAAFHWCAFS
jgi:hypothetical protein